MKNRRFFISGSLLILFIMLAFPLFTRAQMPKTMLRGQNVRSTDLAALEQEVLKLVNRTREENGLAKLVWSAEVAQIARTHSVNMATNNFFSHSGVDGQEVDDRADSIGLKKWLLIGENIAFNSGFEDPAGRAVAGWMNSAGHRRNILRDAWRETGIGIAVSLQGKFFITQVFLKRK